MFKLVRAVEVPRPDFFTCNGGVFHRIDALCAPGRAKYGILRHELHFVSGIRPCKVCKPRAAAAEEN